MSAPSNAVDRLLDKISNNVGRPASTRLAGGNTLGDYFLVWANETQKEICNQANFWFMRKEANLTVDAASEALPADFKDEDGVWIVESDGSFTELDWMDYVDYRRLTNDTPAQPSEYCLDGSGNIIFMPTPDVTYTILLDYWGYLADLAASGASNLLLDKYPDVIEAGATYRAFRQLAEIDDATTWFQTYQAKLADLRAACAERELPDEMTIRVRPDVKGTGIRSFRGRG